MAHGTPRGKIVNVPGIVHIPDPSPELLKQLGIEEAPKGKKNRSESGSVHVKCRRCGEEFTRTKGPLGYEHHQETTGHGAFDCVLTSD